MIRFVSIAAAVAQYRTNQNVNPVIIYHSSLSIDSNGYNNNCKDNWMLYISTIVIFIILMILSVVPLNSNLGIFLGILIIIFLIIPIYTHWKRLHDLRKMNRQSIPDMTRQSPNNSSHNSMDTTINNRHSNLNSAEVHLPTDGSINSMKSCDDLPPKYELPPSYSQTIYSIDI